jgi:putative RNA 2'-phosphotransferase
MHSPAIKTLKRALTQVFTPEPDGREPASSDRGAVESVTPPEFLFHGTTPEASEAIAVHGILPMRRRFVYLYPDIDLAFECASKITPNPVVWRVSATEAHDAGVAFYDGPGDDILTRVVHPKYLARLR